MNRRVLVVEDNEKNMKLFRDVLQARGYETFEAGTGDDAIELATEHVPDLVLMDIELPGTDGVEALGRLRADDRTASIPVLALTAQAMHGDRERFLAAGFDGYMSKPVDVLALLDVVGKYCG
jgi:two-component system cell cycle response regulator DivK